MVLPFSYREGHKKLNQSVQINSMSGELRNGLWNVLIRCYFDEKIHKKYDDLSPHLYRTVQGYWAYVLKNRVDEIDDYWNSIFTLIKNIFFELNWYEVYDLIEYFANNAYIENPQSYGKQILFIGQNQEFIEFCNVVLEREFSGFRFIGGSISKITDQVEINEIEEATNAYSTAKIHLEKALSSLSDRKNPDYKNSIKESVHAIESICQKVTDKNTLGDALKEIKNSGKVDIHPALEQAFSKIYGYTNDAGGIRHAEKIGLEHDVYFEDAKFMLVSVSAFINYLKIKFDKAGVKL